MTTWLETKVKLYSVELWVANLMKHIVTYLINVLSGIAWRGPNRKRFHLIFAWNLCCNLSTKLWLSCALIKSITLYYSNINVTDNIWMLTCVTCAQIFVWAVIWPIIGMISWHPLRSGIQTGAESQGGVPLGKTVMLLNVGAVYTDPPQKKAE
jgi:hypothetical protein